MRIAEAIEVAAPCELVWEQVTDPARVLDFFAGVTRWEVEGTRRTGLGARYRMLLRVRSAASASRVSCISRTMCS